VHHPLWFNQLILLCDFSACKDFEISITDASQFTPNLSEVPFEARPSSPATKVHYAQSADFVFLSKVPRSPNDPCSCNTTIGEKVVSLRSLIKRFTFYTGANIDATNYGIEVDPLYFAGSITPHGGMPLTHYIASMFKYWSGGQRLKVITYSMNGGPTVSIPNDRMVQAFLGPLLTGGSPSPLVATAAIPNHINSYTHIIRDSVSVFSQIQIPYYSPVPYRPMCDAPNDCDQRKFAYFQYTSASSVASGLLVFHAAADDFNLYYLCGPPALIYFP